MRLTEPKRKLRPRPWDLIEDDMLRDGAAAGLSLEALAIKIGRTISATKACAYVLRVSIKRAGLRAKGLSWAEPAASEKIDSSWRFR